MHPLKALALVMVSLGLTLGADAAPVKAEQARSAVIAWLKTSTAPLQTPLGHTLKDVESFTNAAGTTLYYAVSLAPEGFVLVAADDLVEPIISFAPSGQFVAEKENPLAALVNSDLSDRIAKVKGLDSAQAQGALRSARDKWEQLRKIEQGTSGVDLGIPTVADVRVAPLTQTTWDQKLAGGSACYNYYTPPYGDGSANNYYCGCVATAMAQMLRFWQSPVNGVGTVSFPISVNGASTYRNLRGGDGVGGPYVWGNMVLNPNTATLAQRQAIGALCADAGVSVNMDYGSGGSGADTLQAKDAFVTTFGYANAIKGYNSGATIGAGLNGMINPNLDSGCPVLLGITDGSGGHAVVCDGYGYNLSTLYHHVNLGWSGSYTAWYNLPLIDAGGYMFNSVYKCIYNVWPSGTGEIISGRVADGGGTPIAGVTVNATRTGGGTYTALTDARGIYSLARIPSSSTYTISASKAGYMFANQIASTSSSIDYSSTSGNQWGINFISIDPNDPTSFTATPASASRVNLSWSRNSFNDNVMVAWNTSPTFGIPTGAYGVGAAIAGGGTVLYNGSGTTASHTGLNAGTQYYYKAWSVRSGPSYSTGLSASATTMPGVPFTENFEHGGALPNGWTQEYVADNLSWTFQTGSFGFPPTAHSGSFNAVLYVEEEWDHITKLVTPVLDFGAATANAQLTFWHCMEPWDPDQDELRVYYKTSANGSWNLLATYTSAVYSWTQRTLSLPSPGGTYWIAFEGDAMYGSGVCIDDVAVTAQVPPVPVLRIRPVLGQFKLQWPTNSAGFVLETTPILNGSPVWTNCPASPVVEGTNYSITLQPDLTRRFFRLEHL